MGPRDGLQALFFDEVVMADSKTADPAKELEDLIASARKTEHNFVMMKTKEGVVIEASKVKTCEALIPIAKSKGGMSAMMVSGIMKVDGKVMNLRSAEEDVARNLPRLAKRHFKNVGIKCKVMIHLPGGGTLDDEDEGAEGEVEEQKVGDGMVAPVEPGDGEDLKAQLTERMKTIVPQVKAASDQALAGADKLVTAVKAAAGELAAGGFERAGKLLDAIEAGLKSLAPAGPDPAAMREQLQRDFNALRDDLQRVMAAAAKPVAGKARTLADMFATEIGRDLKKAQQALGVLKGLVATEVGKLGSEGKSVLQSVSDGLSNLFEEGVALGEDVKEGIEKKAGEVVGTMTEMGKSVVEGIGKAKDGVEDFVTNLTATPEVRADTAMLDGLGVSRDERIRLLEEWEKDPAKAKAYKTKLLSDAKIPEDRREALLKLQASSPDTFLQMLGTLKAMEQGGETDTSPAATQQAMQKAEAARLEVEAKLKALADANRAATAGMQSRTEALGKRDTAKNTADLAAQAIKDHEITPEALKLLSPQEQNDWHAATTRLINANEAAKKALAEAEKALAAADKEVEKLNDASRTAFDGFQKAEAGKAKEDAALEKIRAKQGLLDAVSFGPLSADAKPPMKDDDKAKLAALYGTDARLADDAIAAARGSKDPSAVAQNAAFVAGKFKDGFADGSGKKLELPADQMRDMAANALRMGAQMGPDYFKGFEDYLKTGKQFDADPHGGMAAPDPDPAKEKVRVKQVAQARTRAMADAALGDDGAVDFGSVKAKGAMDHMLFHPGSLNTFTPQLNEKTAETKKLFTDPATKDKAQGTITATTLPGASTLAKPTSPGTAKEIIGRTVGKAPNALTDNDARASVLTAMMTPLSQGPVGSCFSTAPVRSIRETDPLRAMEEYSKIASTGMFKPDGKPPVPANKREHPGENPLLRSWEYSVATAAANEEDSVQRNRLTTSMFRSTDSANNLGAIQGIMGADDLTWYGYTDTSTGDVVEGIESKIFAATKRDLVFVYNPTAPKAGGGGDGRSSEGRYELMHGSKAIRSEADFSAAIATIALAACGETATSPKGAQIVTLVSSAAFIQSVIDAMKDPSGNGKDYKPWELSSGGFEAKAQKVLDGGDPKREQVLAKPGTPAPSRSDRTAGILTSILGKHGSMPGDMHLLATSGVDAGHAFNALPKHPSMDKIRDPDSAAKIQSELVQPGQRMASTKMPAAQAAKLFREQIEAMMESASEPMRAELVKAIKNAPTSDMTPSEVSAKIKTEVDAATTIAAQKRADKYIAEDEPGANRARRREILDFYKDQVNDETEAALRSRLVAELGPPMVVVADSNWGGAESQDYFVAAPDPMTGDLIMWTRTEPGGKMVPLGQNWEDGPWSWIKP
ncbi:MAG: hypothetical protein KF887_12040 [Paracoccaceae bacterium]|nr:MAG: hypothetical protein KF887_12040 [Paracoccaceae bacterium]